MKAKKNQRQNDLSFNEALVEHEAEVAEIEQRYNETFRGYANHAVLELKIDALLETIPGAQERYERILKGAKILLIAEGVWDSEGRIKR